MHTTIFSLSVFSTFLAKKKAINLSLVYIFVSLFLANFSCKRKPKPIVPDPPTLANFESGKPVGIVQKLELDEISGMVASQNMPGKLWVHNDSGDGPNVYLIDQQANWQASYQLQDVTNRDWEDIATTKINGQSYLLLADIGDNLAAFANQYYIYRCKEPNNTSATSISNVEKISFKYPDMARDAEAIMVDHATNDIYIISKRDTKARVYLLAYPQSTTNITTATFITELSFGGEFGGVPSGATAADISAKNDEILIKNYFQVFYWKLKTNETIKQAISRSYDKLLPYIPNPQEEAICWETNATGYYTLAEGTQASNVVQLYFYKKKQ
jgi:hypothetical protein